MERRPLIGVTTQTLQVIDNIPAGLPHSWVMNRRYLLALTTVGAAPFLVPLLVDDAPALRAIYDAMDGLFLPGGVDLDPSSYGSPRHPLCGTTDSDRDTVELLLARWALDEGKPVLGVCRGLQVLNVLVGGALHQDTGDAMPGSIKHDYYPTAGYARDYLSHEVRLVEGSRLAGAYGASRIAVNSMHHQGIDALAAGLVATAFAEDELIEGVELPGDAFVVGVQWHPEMLIDSDAGTRRLFESFVEAAGAWREDGRDTLVQVR